MPILLFLSKKFENSRTFGCFGGFSGINHLRKTRGLLLQFNQFPWKCADSDGNCRQLSTGVTHPLLPSQAITGTVWWENDWHFLSFTCASFRRLTCRTYFSGKKRTVKQWNRHQNEASGTVWFSVVDQFPENSSEWRFQRTSTTSSEASAEFQKKDTRKKDLKLMWCFNKHDVTLINLQALDWVLGRLYRALQRAGIRSYEWRMVSLGWGIFWAVLNTRKSPYVTYNILNYLCILIMIFVFCRLCTVLQI